MGGGGFERAAQRYGRFRGSRRRQTASSPALPPAGPGFSRFAPSSLSAAVPGVPLVGEGAFLAEIDHGSITPIHSRVRDTCRTRRARFPTMTEVTVPDAVESYLTERSSELSDSSIQNHRYQLKQFRQWCHGAGDVNPLDLSRFRRYRSSDLNSNTMYNQLSVVRLFLRFCHRMGWVEEALPESIVLPTRSGRSRDRSIDADRAGEILDGLERYQFASFNHVLFSLLWTCGMRIGTVRSLDVGDSHLDEQWTDVVHRSETDTPLKNGDDSTREVNLHGWIVDILEELPAERPGNRGVGSRPRPRLRSPSTDSADACAPFGEPPDESAVHIFPLSELQTTTSMHSTD